MNTVCFVLLVSLAVAQPDDNDNSSSDDEVSWSKFEKFAKAETSSLLRKSLPALMRSVRTENVSEECQTSMMRYVIGLTKWTDWAVW
ncbi:hypothetical protein AVEN_201391-1, partial [Araneus ventricosus]